MTIASGRAGTITPKDWAIMEDLFWCRYLTTRQIASLHYNATSSCRRRLSQLKPKGYIDNRVIYTIAPTRDSFGKRESVWHLTKQAFEAIAESFDYEESWNAKQLGPMRTDHYLKANEVYIASKENLNSILDPHPESAEWEWENELRAFENWELAGETQVHMPDAHVRFRNNLFIIERQTNASNPTQEEIYDKVIGHKTYVTKLLEMDPEEVEILFACDDERVPEIARRAGKEHGIHVVAGDVEKIAFHLYQSALRLK